VNEFFSQWTSTQSQNRKFEWKYSKLPAGSENKRLDCSDVEIEHSCHFK
jgi:hypothetical protein